jgi:alpha-galactosidase/6-phospho-beta-glucosidase family protein
VTCKIVDIGNDGAPTEVEVDDVDEVPAGIDREGAHPLKQEQHDPKSAALVRHQNLLLISSDSNHGA